MQNSKVLTLGKFFSLASGLMTINSKPTEVRRVEFCAEIEGQNRPYQLLPAWRRLENIPTLTFYRPLVT
jgi:hypothetical protein